MALTMLFGSAVNLKNKERIRSVRLLYNERGEHLLFVLANSNTYQYVSESNMYMFIRIHHSWHGVREKVIT